MKLVIIPPYKRVGVNYSPTEGHFLVNELVNDMRKNGQLEGVEVDIDEGYPTEHTGENRDAEVVAIFAVGFLKRVKECSQSGKYDAIVSSGGGDLAFLAARMISRIPVTYSIHAAVHVASLIGDRFSCIDMVDAGGAVRRQAVQNYGLNDKLASIRSIERSSPYVLDLILKHKKGKRSTAPELKKFFDHTVAVCIDRKSVV
jgi:hypothetical protein